MNAATGVITRKPRPKQTGTLLGVRLQPDQLVALDAWISTQPDAPTRPEAVRRLIAAALGEKD